ncbi:CD82 molecule a [Ictalurus punctatus]|uniref:Tetraspanin n=1 Tax=Ictalurus punctatus TaxID=7998 RepID=A0A979F276_ICTPU|nr:CD82 molecule a [Ictalurus punctatus]XP_047014275.1 CD82 molecule a [Ictalurus punctatus]XP_053539292.1 CD82 molecule a [Ictalurus punctatus]
MGKGCISATKYFLFLFNLLFFIFGALIMGFGLWILLDNQSFIAVLQDSSTELKVGSYIVVGVGGFTMLMGFLGCLGAIYEIRCLLGLYFTLLLLILLAQVVTAVLIFLQRDQLRHTTADIVKKLVENYQGQNKTAEHAWDYIQRNMHCCGWINPEDWQSNPVINSSLMLYPCSCQNNSVTGENTTDGSFCKAQSSDWPVYDSGCMTHVESWLFTNYGVILGICLGVAVIELLAMILSMGLCKSVHQEDYTKVPKY